MLISKYYVFLDEKDKVICKSNDSLYKILRDYRNIKYNRAICYRTFDNNVFSIIHHDNDNFRGKKKYYVSSFR